MDAPVSVSRPTASEGRMRRGTKLAPPSLGKDLAAGLVVFLVALPLCLGIALASGAPLFSGIIAGVIGGIVVGALSGSHVSVAGPAAGLTAVVLSAIGVLGSFEAFLLAVFLAGLMQAVLGLARAGAFSSYLPSSVIEGMLTAIGVIIIIKQLPHTAGLSGGAFQPGALLVAGTGLLILNLWGKGPTQRWAAVPGALLAVVTGTVLNEALAFLSSDWALGPQFLVSLPTPKSLADFAGLITLPDFSRIGDGKVWVTAATIAAVASVETLLCIEAADKLDVHKRYTDTNRELKAQGIGNALCGLLGGLPVTSVIVRTTANINAGAESKRATISHGTLLLLAVLLVPGLLNRIPLAALAAVLIMVGWKLAGPQSFLRPWRAGKYQFAPFIVTVASVVATDLLKGVAIGLMVSVALILIGNMTHAYHFKREEHHEGETIHLELAEEVSFLNKAAIKRVLTDLPDKSILVVDASRSVYIDHDVLELIRDFLAHGAATRGIRVRLTGFKKAYRVEDAVQVTSH